MILKAEKVVLKSIVVGVLIVITFGSAFFLPLLVQFSVLTIDL